MNNNKVTKEELHFRYWLDELMSKNLIIGYVEQPKQWLLTPPVHVGAVKHFKTKTKVESVSLLQDWKYGPDFMIELPRYIPGYLKKIFQNLDELVKPLPLMYVCNGFCHVEIKPIHRNPNQAMSDHKFPLNRKAVWDKYKVYVNKVIPIKLFEQTFTPKKVILEEVYQKNCKHGLRGDSKLKYPVKTIKEFLHGKRTD